MVELGMLPRANYVLLAPPQKVVNPAFLSLFAPHLTASSRMLLWSTSSCPISASSATNSSQCAALPHQLNALSRAGVC